MSKKTGSRKSRTKSRPSPSTKKSNASTLTSKRAQKARKLAIELYAHSLSAPKNDVEDAIVEGSSMWPLLRPGFRIRFRRVRPDTLAPGDLIVVERTTRSGEAIVQVHRLIGRTGPLFVEAGDNTYSASAVTGESIHGKVEKIWDGEGEAVAIPVWSLRHSRFRFFLTAASTFFFAHELKDRLLGQRKSLLLWKAAKLYHRGLGVLGLRVPTLLPRTAR